MIIAPLGSDQILTIKIFKVLELEVAALSGGPRSSAYDYPHLIGPACKAGTHDFGACIVLPEHDFPCAPQKIREFGVAKACVMT